ncbi:oligosaccharide flippase family protein [Vibrio cyclitrophicus]
MINKKLFAVNVISLSVLQYANYLLPLFLYPFLTLVLGLENFGKLAFALSFTMYFKIIIDYGFDFTATKSISIVRDDVDKVSKLFVETVTAKLLLTFICFIVCILLYKHNEIIGNDLVLVLSCFSVIAAGALLPTWLYQGLESMKYVTVVTLISKLIMITLVFVFVKNENDYYIFPMINAIVSFIASIILIVIAKKKFNLRLNLCSIKGIKFQLEQGWHVFLAGLFTSAYTTSSVFILGMMSDAKTVGLFALCEKIVKSIGTISQPINKALYPIISKINISDTYSSKRINSLTLSLLSMFMLLTSCILYVFSDYLSVWFNVGGSIEFSELLKLLSIYPLIITVNRFLSVNCLLSNGFNKTLLKIYMINAVFALVMFFSLIPIWQAKGAAITILMVEAFGMVMMLLFCLRKRLIYV